MANCILGTPSMPKIPDVLGVVFVFAKLDVVAALPRPWTCLPLESVRLPSLISSLIAPAAKKTFAAAKI